MNKLIEIVGTIAKTQLSILLFGHVYRLDGARNRAYDTILQ